VSVNVVGWPAGHPTESDVGERFSLARRIDIRRLLLNVDLAPLNLAPAGVTENERIGHLAWGELGLLEKDCFASDRGSAEFAELNRLASDFTAS